MARQFTLCGIVFLIMLVMVQPNCSVPLAPLMPPKTSPLGLKDTVSFLRGDARLIKPSINGSEAIYDMHIHTRASSPSWLMKMTFGTLMLPVLGAIRTELQKSWFDKISPFFFDEGTSGVTYDIKLDGKIFQVVPADKLGLSTSLFQITIPATTFTGYVDVINPFNNQLLGQIQLMSNYVNDNSYSIITDVDDTIRITQVLSLKKTIENTLINPFQPTKNFVAFFQHLTHTLGKISHESMLLPVSFHYVSGSPHYLYTPLHRFITDFQYPVGGLFLRSFDALNFDFWAGTQPFKLKKIDKLLKRYGNRQWILIGDSGQLDPETYAKVYLGLPPAIQNNIRCIYIRKIAGTNAKKEAQLNSPERFRSAFASVPKNKWATFYDPQEVMGADIHNRKCA